MSRYRAVEELRADYPVVRLCRLVEVSTSGYYGWRSRPPSARELVDRQLLVEIVDIHRSSRHTYGAPRVHGQLARRGHHIGRKRVARLMRREGLVGAHGRKKGRRRKVDVAPAPDLLQRDFSAARPNQRWVADITEFKTGEGKLYVAAIRDLCHRGIVGWSMDDSHRAELVVDALTMALRRTSIDRQRRADSPLRQGRRVSVQRLRGRSRRAEPAAVVWPHRRRLRQRRHGDRATIKREIEHIRGSLEFATRAQARAFLFDYIEIFYNRQRHQARLGHLTPTDYAAGFAA